MDSQTFLASLIVFGCVFYMGRYVYLRYTGRKSPCSYCPSSQNKTCRIEQKIHPR